ncbi:TatD family hydrolase [Roseateles sp. BYS78W]|uniref:TatD family hydrolase n=1 Tax=Pelomonas candidula TaxID=3299025 RepID=A0ABW7H8H7_9BURK
MIDIGVNFHASQLKGLGAELLQRASAVGVTDVLATGTSLAASRQELAFAREQVDGPVRVWATAGVHPHDAKAWPGTEPFEALWADPLVVAVGECGLDYNRMFSPAADQRRVFLTQIAAAIRLDKPLFLHCRDAFEDFHAMLRDASRAGARGVVHCFTDGAEQAEAYLALGFDIGITGWVSDIARGSALRDALRVVPLDHMHLETDAPYLRPKNAGKTRPYNEPALLPFVAQAVAEHKRVDLNEVAAQTSAASRRLFRLTALPVAQPGVQRSS